ncbi:alpha-1,2-mannosyltransferase ALG9 isoform X2 [Aristolochia californica]|uniref:alpha-1,2-mannosyltransferase ALG9 isoform X2 n=1 Tax=Aristolochia californica TaxID=171875 RepID=UPI0035DA35FF
MDSSTRRRRPPTSEPSSSSSYSKLDKPEKADDGGRDSGLNWKMAFVCLALLRYMSATSNIIHDCDEVFNYWEPLHYLLYGSGFQTWEYSNNTLSQFRVFYSVRLYLGLISAITETVLVVALSRKYGKRLASYALAMLCLSSGCFFASTSFLPSSFSMYSVSLSSALFLLEKPALAVSVAAVGVLLGWPFSILAVLPVTLYSLISATSRKQVFLTGIVTSLVILVLSIFTDCYYYGRWTSSIFNLLVYNVLGGGESHLYGTEGVLFYMRNGFNNFNVSFILAGLFLGILPIAKKKYAPDLLVVLSPLYIWLLFMSLQPHKEERFLYPIYPLICVAAAAVIESFPDVFRDKYAVDDSPIVKVAKFLRPVALGLILCASHARTFSILNGYSAPLQIYKHLEHHEEDGIGSVVCVGSEWHRYPSSFFVPSYVREVRWIDDGFRGLLPFPFNSTLGGTAAAPPYFNNKNKASEEQYLRDLDACTFLVELDLARPYPSRGRDLSTWEAVSALHYLDRELSPPFHRAFFIPNYWMQKNVFGLYKLQKRIPK